MLTLEQLNCMTQAEFTEALGAIFENTPAIANQTWDKRPFSSLEQLYQSLITTVEALSVDAKVALIQAHPDLGTKAKMAESSVQEQAGAGLNQLSPEEYQIFLELNQAYKDKFGFPFIIAVRNHTKSSILEAFRKRLQHSGEQEMQQALTEISKIAEFRLKDLITA